MEFPGLGKHCTQPTCRQLDFLPVKCDACKNIFCSEHYKYESHSCPVSYKKNVQVPVCPLCNNPVPGKSDELPDIRVSQHIDSDCQSDKALAQRKKVYTNRCSYKGCKTKELIPILCDSCGNNYCLKHRHFQDHACTQTIQQSQTRPMNKSALAALSRTRLKSSNPSSTSSNPSNGGTFVRGSGSESMIQGNLSEDAALAMALQASLGPQNISNGIPISQEQEDFLLAQAIAESERESQHRPTPTPHRRIRNCELS